MCDKVFVTETRSERISDILEFSPQNVKMPRLLSANATTLASRLLVETLNNTTPNAPFAKINDTNHAALRSLAELFNIISKSAEQKSTNRHNGCRCGAQEVSVGPNQIAHH